jgi:hypothetical protein
VILKGQSDIGRRGEAVKRLLAGADLDSGLDIALGHD